MITGKLNYDRIDPKYLFQGKNGKYLDIVFFTNKNGKDEHGNDGFVVQGIPKDARERGERGPVIGNWRNFQPQSDQRPAAPAPAATQRPLRPGGTMF